MLLTKDELVKDVAGKAGISQIDAGKAVSAFTSSVQEALVKGDSVKLIGFGIFCVTERAARTGRNPATGKPIDIPARRVPKFKAGTTLKEAMNK